MLIINGRTASTGSTGTGDMPANTIEYATLRGVGGEWVETGTLKTYSDHILATEVRSVGRIVSGSGNVEVTSAAGDVQLEAIEQAGALDSEILVWNDGSGTWSPSNIIDGKTF